MLWAFFSSHFAVERKRIANDVDLQSFWQNWYRFRITLRFTLSIDIPSLWSRCLFAANLATMICLGILWCAWCHKSRLHSIRNPLWFILFGKFLFSSVRSKRKIYKLLHIDRIELWSQTWIHATWRLNLMFALNKYRLRTLNIIKPCSVILKILILLVAGIKWDFLILFYCAKNP